MKVNSIIKINDGFSLVFFFATQTAASIGDTSNGMQLEFSGGAGGGALGRVGTKRPSEELNLDVRPCKVRWTTRWTTRCNPTGFCYGAVGLFGRRRPFCFCFFLFFSGKPKISS